MGEKENMKSVRISDETYTKIVRNAKKNRRTISGTIELLVEYGMQIADTANMGMGMGVASTPVAISESKTMTIEEFNEKERERKEKMGYKPKEYEDDELTEEELFAMNQRNKTY